ncbi:MAG: hypothetical protein B5766_12900 [Candidatus Lumbricidophila eiseniae]|uniref:Uncharacterized protein n=1 Tax=Candidatus Lumbricidiphila eiseniae TaxID=1969409 RepID=A0A2A6FML5_9MICO|nr:MAG: hypothetical protein B5766_12900 [Candidatus Lumbricidophila eiseniae]
MGSTSQGAIEAVVEAQIDADIEQKIADSDADSFVAAVGEFVAASPWLGPEHQPALVVLRTLARQLDVHVTAALVAQFGVTFRDLRSQVPTGGAASSDDGVGKLLDEALGS